MNIPYPIKNLAAATNDMLDDAKVRTQLTQLVFSSMGGVPQDLFRHDAALECAYRGKVVKNSGANVD